MAPVTVALVGANGETGTSIVNGLLAAGQFSVKALTRPSSVSKPAIATLRERGVEIIEADLTGPEEKLIEALKGVDVVVSAIGPRDQLDQIPLATAAKKAGVKRFLPCGFITVAPPGGIMSLRDVKEDVNNHIKQIGLSYTYVDVGWWYQISYPRLPSGKIDYAAAPVMNMLCKDGNTPSALTDLRDIGHYIAKIIVDERTENKYVLVYNEVWTFNKVWDLVEKLSGEQLDRQYTSEKEIRDQISASTEALKTDPTSFQHSLGKIGGEYQLSWGIRGDNTPEYAKYLGYLTSKELYPDMKYCAFEDFIQEVLAGNAKGVYEEMKEQMRKAAPQAK